MIFSYFFLVLLFDSSGAIELQELTREDSNAFLRSTLSPKKQFELSRELVESTRESCLSEYQQQRSSQRRQNLSPVCVDYCATTSDCHQENEPSACLNPLWPTRTLKFAQKFQRVCYVRITEVLRYDQAERLCHQYGLELAIIDNLPLLEQLKQMNMFNTTTCKGQCPEARGYYIGLRRQMTDEGLSDSEWIWSNNMTWKQNETECDGDIWTRTSFVNATFLCYIGSDGKKRVTVWNLGEPNNHRYSAFQHGEQCVEIIARQDRDGSIEHIGKLNDIPCNKPALGVICQKNDTKPTNNSRFDYFATLMGFNQTEPEEEPAIDLLGNLFSTFGGSVPADINAMAVMAAALEGLLVLPSFTTEQAGSVLNVVDQLVNVTGQIEVEDDSLKSVTNKLLNFLDRFSGKIQIEQDHSTSFINENMNTSLVDMDLQHWLEGSDDDDYQEWFTINQNSSDEQISSVIQLNLRVLRKSVFSIDHYRLIETIFSNFNLFPQMNTSNNTNLIGVPISYQIANWTRVHASENLIRYRIRVSASVQSQSVSCVYWSFDENNGSWVDDNGCQFDGIIEGYAQCSCNHLTHFALLMVPESESLIESLTVLEELILTYVTYIGIALSICGLVVTLITYLLFRCSQRNRIHASLFMLCLSILCVNCLYVPFSLIKPKFKSTANNPFCNVIAFLFHYFLLTSFMWMFIVAIIQYVQFVRIFNSHISHFFLKTCFVGWVFPLLFPLLVVLIDRQGYIGQSRCWINNPSLLYSTFVVPILFILVCNSILFLFTLKSIFHHDSTIATNINSRSKLQVGAAICCFVSIGCTWFFALLVLLQPIFLHQLIFCICNSLQGFLIFLFHVYLSKPKRELWQTFFLQHGLHPRPHSTYSEKNLINKSHSSLGHVSSLTRPVAFRFASTSSNSDPNGNLVSHSTNQVSRESLERVSNPALRSQADFFRERLEQKNRLSIQNSYA